MMVRKMKKTGEFFLPFFSLGYRGQVTVETRRSMSLLSVRRKDVKALRKTPLERSETPLWTKSTPLERSETPLRSTPRLNV
jgi:hypothetical protein